MLSCPAVPKREVVHGENALLIVSGQKLPGSKKKQIIFFLPYLNGLLSHTPKYCTSLSLSQSEIQTDKHFVKIKRDILFVQTLLFWDFYLLLSPITSHIVTSTMHLSKEKDRESEPWISHISLFLSDFQAHLPSI